MDAKAIPKFTQSLEARLRGTRNVVHDTTNYEAFVEDYTKIINQSEQTPRKNRAYADCLHHLLEVAYALDENEVPNVITGGLAVLAYRYGANPASLFEEGYRGTDDIDILVDEALAAHVLRELGFQRVQGRTFEQHPDHGTTLPITTYTKHVNGNELKVQIRRNLAVRGRVLDDIYETSRPIAVYGIPVRVVGFVDLKKLKEDAGRPKDKYDLKMLRKLEQRR